MSPSYLINLAAIGCHIHKNHPHPVPYRQPCRFSQASNPYNRLLLPEPKKCSNVVAIPRHMCDSRISPYIIWPCSSCSALAQILCTTFRQDLCFCVLLRLNGRRRTSTSIINGEEGDLLPGLYKTPWGRSQNRISSSRIFHPTPSPTLCHSAQVQGCKSTMAKAWDQASFFLLGPCWPATDGGATKPLA